MVGDIRGGKYSPKQMAALVILVAMAMVSIFVEVSIIPSAPWLKYDPSAIIAMIAALCFGPWMGVAVAVLSWVPRLVTDPLGSFMNIMASVSVVVVMGLIYRQKPSLSRAFLGALVGSVCSIALSIALNFIVTPLYLETTVEQVAASVVPILLPFNALKLGINCSVALIAYRKLADLLAEEDTTVPPIDVVSDGLPDKTPSGSVEPTATEISESR